MQTTLTIKTDKKLRDAAKKTAKALGIPLTTVINANLREFVRNGHFEVSLTPRPSKVAEWEADRVYHKIHPEEIVKLSSPTEMRKHFLKISRSNLKK